jgi:3-oxoacyl-[acyl-carrier protein] reductase
LTESFKTDFQDNIAVVSGGFQGIGKAIVDRLALSGCRVYTIDPKFPAEAGKFVHGNKITTYSGYTSKTEDVKEFLQYITDREDHIDFLVNNAGIYLYRNVEDSSESDFDKIIGTNLFGTFIFTKYFAKLLRKSTHPSVVNIASVSGQRTEEGHPLYSMTKGGIIGFTKALAADLGKYNIRVNSVSPGNIITPMNDLDIEAQSKIKGKSFEEIEKDYSSESILKRRGTPDEVASVVLFFLSSASSYINGEDIIVDGGLYLV